MRRLYHPWTEWECVRAGMYETGAGFDSETAQNNYAAFLSDLMQFEAALIRVLNEWPRSCEHFLSNDNTNRIAWLGQASMCIATGTPSIFRGGFKRLSPEQQRRANALAARYLATWIKRQADASKDRRVREHMETQRLFA